jgi:MFS family permease
MVAPLRDPRGDFGWGIGTIGALMAVYYLVGGLFAPISGWLGARYGARRLMLAGGLLYGGSMLLLGLVREPWHFLLACSLAPGPHPGRPDAGQCHYRHGGGE